MLKKITTTAIGAAFVLTTNITSAEGIYAGASWSFLEYSEDFVSEDASLNVLAGRVGFDINDYLSSELRLGFGVGDDTVAGIDVEINYLIGGFVRAGAPVTDYFYPYVALGYTRLQLEAMAGSVGSDDSDNDISYAIGADFDVSDSITINAEYTNYYDKDGAEISGFSIGAVINF